MEIFWLFLFLILIVIPILYYKSKQRTRYALHKHVMRTKDLNPLLLMSATKLAEKIRTKQVTSEEVIRVHIEHIKKVNPFLNAIVKDRFEEALKEAKQADELIASTTDPSKLPPFLGVPCSIKECFELKGMPNSSGLISRKNVISKQGKTKYALKLFFNFLKDATAVKRLMDAGFIPLGVTNLSELCMCKCLLKRIES